MTGISWTSVQKSVAGRAVPLIEPTTNLCVLFEPSTVNIESSSAGSPALVPGPCASTKVISAALNPDIRIARSSMADCSFPTGRRVDFASAILPPCNDSYYTQHAISNTRSPSRSSSSKRFRSGRVKQWGLVCPLIMETSGGFSGEGVVNRTLLLCI